MRIPGPHPVAQEHGRGPGDSDRVQGNRSHVERLLSIRVTSDRPVMLGSTSGEFDMAGREWRPETCRRFSPRQSLAARFGRLSYAHHVHLPGGTSWVSDVTRVAVKGAGAYLLHPF